MRQSPKTPQVRKQVDDMATKAQTRRGALLDMLRAADGPLSGGEIAKQLGVSRQIIVQDISLLRESGSEIVATTRGYVLAVGAQPPAAASEGAAPATAEPFQRTFKVHHSVKETGDELETIIDLGGHVLNVSISHRAYGRVTAPLDIATHADIANFIHDIESGKSSPLCTATSGYHYHLVAADTEEALEAIGRALADKGYLAPLLPHEQQ